ncbi:hypothetical protein AMS70_12495 [Acinetobacter sp. JS678]|nr:hypothetical protein AMS70_12495 [Acinetobacter sp. JS678]
MSDKIGKLLCVGGSLNGKWADNLGEFEDNPYANPLRAHVYKPKMLRNPNSGEDELFYLYKELNEDRIEFAVKYALDNQLN